MVRALIIYFFMTAAVAAAQGPQTFTGTVTDSMCAQADHSQMRMGSTDADCTVACIFAHDGRYVLYDGSEVYMLSDQQAPRGGPHPLDRVSSQLRWNPVHDSSCLVCWLSSSPSVSVRLLRRPVGR